MISIVEVEVRKGDTMEVEIKKILINGDEYITVKNMSRIVNKSDQTIYHLINKGNVIRKMKCIKIEEKVLIPYSEVVEFPFTYAGHNAKENTYHFNYEGKVVNDG